MHFPWREATAGKGSQVQESERVRRRSTEACMPSKQLRVQCQTYWLLKSCLLIKKKKSCLYSTYTVYTCIYVICVYMYTHITVDKCTHGGRQQQCSWISKKVLKKYQKLLFKVCDFQSSGPMCIT
jgi:hypothetical protein